ncbi:MAG TPA: DUF1553 domain-containing protein, partial [Tepidisphaeraceae bacterium]|nr:DUF1553 domain-containing protein [Tepidisphaeraceae bacterium]
MRDVAKRYGELLVNAHKTWRELLKKAGEDKTPVPEALPDRDQEELRRVLYGVDSPVLVPNGAIVDLEWFFDEGGRVELAKLQAEIDRWIIKSASPPYAVILADRQTLRSPRVFVRGNPANKGEEVPRQFLEILAGENRKPFSRGSGRLELAEAIASKENPLTARVMVNRIWLWHFGGQGLVKTPSDFGLRCDPATHPDLLDYLAKKFMNNNWSIKKLHREILLSSTYQQSNSGLSTQDLGLKSDPENLLLSHFPAQRLDFESLHDTLLAASGELDLKMGGRPVELFTTPAAKRRAVYGRVDRQFLPGVLRTFDFANPDLHSPQRATTTVPQQALFMMNSPFVIDRARALASRKDVTSIADPAQRVERLFQIVYQRRATPNEIQAAQNYLSRAASDPMPEKPKPISTVWEYGAGEFDPATGKTKSFSK